MSTVTWTGATSTDYMDFNNWVPSLVPGDPDTAIFGTGARTVVTITHKGSASAWQFTGGSYTNTIGKSVDFFISGPGVQVTSGSATIVASTQ